MHDNSPKLQRVSLKERAFTMGEFIGINGYQINRTLLKSYFAKIGYAMSETPHFLVGQHKSHSKTLVIHWFSPGEIDVTLGSYLLSNLKSLGILAQPQQFSDVFGVILFSLYPHDIQHAQKLFALNTLKHYRSLLKSSSDIVHSSATADIFTGLYKRVFELLVGSSILDAGCSFGFLPFLLGERFPTLTRVVGIDIEAEPFPIIRTIAEEHSVTNVSFQQADLLLDNSDTLGRFDTITVLHVLEHFSEQQMYQVLKRLLKMASRRLIVAVPYEEELETAYGHQQLFSEQKLESVGDWCIQQMQTGQIRSEYCEGGLLIIDRY